jgi:anti-sigma factor RsiW
VSANDHARWSEDVGAYLLGALPDEDRVGFERHLAACPDCRREVEELAVAADALPAGAPPVTPPPELKQRIMAVVDAEASLLAAAGGRADATEPAPRRERRGFFARRWTFRPAFALAASAFLLAVGVAGGVLAGGGSGERTVTAQATGAAASASAELEISDDRATLVARNLPPAPSGKGYMVWLKRPGVDAPEPTSVIFTPRADGSATAAVPSLGDAEAVLVNTESLEGNATTPTSAPVLTATLT